MARRSTGKKLRFEILKRDGFSCQYCGRHPPTVLLHVDHIIAVSQGGKDDADNLVTACQDCNLGKGARALSSTPESLQAKAEQIAEAEAQLRGYQALMLEKASRQEDELWQVADVLWPGSPQRGANRRDLLSIKHFLRRLGVFEVLELAELSFVRQPAGGKSQWLYFCACCWRRIREIEGEK